MGSTRYLPRHATLHAQYGEEEEKRENIFKETSFLVFVPSVFLPEQLGSALWHHHPTCIWLKYQQNAT